MVASEDLKEAIRSHHDIDKGDAPYLKKAARFYEGLAQRAAKNGHTVDIFSAALHQTGLHEMRYLTMLTGYVCSSVILICILICILYVYLYVFYMYTYMYFIRIPSLGCRPFNKLIFSAFSFNTNISIYTSIYILQI